MSLSPLSERAIALRKRYEAHERETYGRAWSLEELMLGLVGDVGDLAKLVQAHEGVRQIEDAGRALGHELADVMWAVLVIAHECDIDLEKAFEATMSDLEARLATDAS